MRGEGPEILTEVATFADGWACPVKGARMLAAIAKRAIRRRKPIKWGLAGQARGEAPKPTNTQGPPSPFGLAGGRQLQHAASSSSRQQTSQQLSNPEGIRPRGSGFG